MRAERPTETEAAPSGPAPDNGRGPRTALRVLQLALIVVLAWGVYRTISPDLAQLSWDQLARFRPAPLPLLLSTGLLLAVYFAHALLWRRIMDDLGLARPSARDTVRVYFLASLGRYIPGKLWQLAGLAVLARGAGLPAGGAAAAAVLGQIAFLTTGVFFIALLLPRWAEGTAALATAVLLGVGAAAGWLLVSSRRGRALRRRLVERAPTPLRARLETAVALTERISGATALAWAAGYGLTWVALGLAFTVFVSAFVPDALAFPRHLAGTIAVSYLWGYIMIIAPAGIGVREIAMSGLLAQVPGFPVGAAVVIPVASRLWFTAAEILPLASVPLLPDRSKRA